MAWQQSDLDALDANIASGVMRTRFADGREVHYQSLDHMLQARRVISNELTLTNQAAQGFVRRKFASFRTGF
jgi:hypothetical protein